MSSRFTSFVWGGLIGLAVGILYAPRSGEETRGDLKKLADGYLEQGLESFESQKDRVIEAVETGRQTALEKSDEIKDKVQETRDRLKAQVDAAAEAAKEKINVAAGKAKSPGEAGETPQKK